MYCSLLWQLKFILTPYVRALTKGLPHSTKLPPFEYGLIGFSLFLYSYYTVLGCFDYFQVILKPLLSYSDLRSGVFQAFQEVGNSVVFLQLLEGSLVGHSYFFFVELYSVKMLLRRVS